MLEPVDKQETPSRPTPCDVVETQGGETTVTVADDILRDEGFLELEDYLAKFQVVTSEPRFRALYQLVHANELSASKLAERLDMDKGTLHYHLDKLVNAGLVQNRRRTERRAGEAYSYYTATDIGHRLLATVTGFVRHDQAPEERMDPQTFAAESAVSQGVDAQSKSRAGERVVVVDAEERRRANEIPVDRKDLAQQITASFQQCGTSGGDYYKR